MHTIELISYAMLVSAFFVSVLGVYINFKIKQEYAKYFMYFSFSVALWCSMKALSLSNLYDISYMYVIFVGLYILAHATSSFFLFFAYVFYKGRISKTILTLGLGNIALNTLLLLKPGVFLDKIVYVSGDMPQVFYNKFGAFIYVASFIFIYVLAYVILLVSYFKFQNRIKKFQTLYLMFATSIPPIVGLIANMILPIFFGIHNFSWIAQVSVTLAVAITAYGLTKYQLFNMRMVLSEVFVIIVWVVSFVKLFNYVSLQRFIVDLVYFILLAGFGILILHNTKKELAQTKELEKITKRLKQANKKLKELDQIKTEFLSLATHQLRTPISSIRGYSSMLLEGDYGALSKSIRDIIQKIFKSATVMSEIVTDFLDVSRIELGKVKYQKELVSCEYIIKNVIDELYPKVKNAGLDLHVKKCSNKCAPVIYADKSYMRHVFSNLIENAVKYTPKGGHIFVSADINKKHIVFKIQDTGIGINKKDLNKIFSKFTRAQNAQKHRIDGSGLGLYIVKKIVEDHGGRIWVHSDGEGKGTTFFVQLPLVNKYCKNNSQD